MARHSVLVVDDEAQLRRIVMQLLEEEGFTVRGAATGREAIAEIRRHPPDVVLLDMQLPDVSGGDVARFIHEHGLHSKIIVLTAAHSARALARQWGAQGYVAKPFALLRLLEVLEQTANEDAAYPLAA